MKICVIGGTGFLGKAFVNKLLLLDKNVLVIGRRSQPDDFPCSAEYIQSDCSHPEEIKSFLTEVTEIIDFSYTTTPKTSFDDPLADLISNVPRTVALFEATKQLKHLNKLIVISSGGTVYGKSTTLPIVEHFPTRPLSPYGITKLTIEQYVNLYQQMYGLPSIIVRPSNAYGPKSKIDESQGFINVAFQKILNKQEVIIFGKSGTIRDYIFIDDLIDALVSVLSRGHIGKTYNVGTGVGTSNLELLKIMKDIISPSDLEIRHKILPGRAFDVPANILNSTLLQQDTGWKPKVTLKEGLSRTWNATVSRKEV